MLPNTFHLSLTFRKYNSATRILGILLANKISNRVADPSGTGAWSFIYNGYTIGNGPFQALSKDAIMDTGTAWIYLDDSIVSAYWAQVTGAYSDPINNGYIFPCLSALPPLTLSIGNYDAVVPGICLSAYVLGNGGKWSTISLSNDRLADLFN
jgi:hypothetical protein